MNFLEGMRHFGNRKLQGKEDNNMMNFAVVVVTYNRLELLKECLECIRNQELVPNNVVIVDNNSTDGTGKYLNGVKEIIEHQWMVKHEEQNIGGAGGFHDGLKLAMETDSEWFLLIDDDAMIAPNYLSLIAESIEKHPSILAYSGTVVTENNIMIEHRRRFKKAEVPVPIEEYKQADFEYDLCSFCGAVINRKVVNQIGYPERDFFIWYDDTEYSLRMMNVSKFLNIASLANLKVRYEIENNESVSKATYALLDTRKIKNIGWEPQYSVKDGLKRTYTIKKETLGSM